MFTIAIDVTQRVLERFDTLPGHLTEDLQLFSLNDLTAVRNGELAPKMKELLKLGTVHVGSCVVRNQPLQPQSLVVQQGGWEL